MEKRFLDKVEYNVAVRIWSEKTQLEKGDCLIEGYVSEFCFTFGKVDLVPTMEEYTTLLCFSRIQADKAYSRAANVSTFLKKFMSITGMNLILVHPDTKKRVDIFVLCIYGLVIFPKALGHVDEAVSDLFDRLNKRVMPVPKVEKVFYRVFSENYSLLKEFVVMPRRNNILEEKWMAILQSLQDKDVEWRSHWMIPDEILYQCGDLDWVPLLEIQRAIGYAPLLGDNYKKNVREISNAWNQTRRMKRFAVNPMITPEYDWWWRKRKLEAEKMRKRKNKAEEDLDSLKIDYKKLRLSIRTARLGKTLDRNSAIELKTSLNNIKVLKGKIEELKAIRDRDHIMGEAVTQVREVDDHLQILAVQADMLSLKYEPDRGRELAWLLRKDKALSIKARVSVTIRPQPYQAGTSAPINYPIGSGFNLEDNPTNPVVPDLDRARVEAMKNDDYLCGVDAKDLSLVLDLDSLVRSVAKWYNQLSHAKINLWKDLAQAFMKQYSHVTDMTPDRITL
ncbi:hypothetical protein Godav_025035 [Gossypium davidsonii]|uniref:DUF7745 domain-containing protein n=1 Tax=Gossypium davidsonii TaxID=34287 RepID=A0A7J8TK09_GOSDV|nr:hypothetical protein [Gossypium davidsonii]